MTFILFRENYLSLQQYNLGLGKVRERWKGLEWRVCEVSGAANLPTPHKSFDLAILDLAQCISLVVIYGKCTLQMPTTRPNYSICLLYGGKAAWAYWKKFEPIGPCSPSPHTHTHTQPPLNPPLIKSVSNTEKDYLSSSVISNLVDLVKVEPDADYFFAV